MLTTRYGLDCYGYALLAAGHIDLAVEAALKNVDICPLIPLIENAGGVVTTWEGGPAEQGGNMRRRGDAGTARGGDGTCCAAERNRRKAGLNAWDRRSIGMKASNAARTSPR